MKHRQRERCELKAVLTDKLPLPSAGMPHGCTETVAKPSISAPRSIQLSLTLSLTKEQNKALRNLASSPMLTGVLCA